jgi:hypothetical protein
MMNVSSLRICKWLKYKNADNVPIQMTVPDTNVVKPGHRGQFLSHILIIY